MMTYNLTKIHKGSGRRNSLAPHLSGIKGITEDQHGSHAVYHVMIRYIETLSRSMATRVRSATYRRALEVSPFSNESVFRGQVDILCRRLCKEHCIAIDDGNRYTIGVIDYVLGDLASNAPPSI